MEGYLQKRGFRLTLLLLFFLGALVGIYLLRDVFAPVILGFLIAYVLDPFADALERRKFSRLGAVVTIFASFAIALLVVVVVGVFYAVLGVESAYHKVVGEKLNVGVTAPATGVLEPGVHFEDRNGDGELTPGYVEGLQSLLRGLMESEKIPPSFEAGARQWLNEKRAAFALTEEEKQARVVERLRQLEQWLIARVERRIQEGRSPAAVPLESAIAEKKKGIGVLGLLSYLVLCPLYVFFFLLEIDPMIAGIRRYLPAAQKERVVRIFRAIDQTLAAFFRGRLIVCMLKGGLTAAGLFFLGVPFWLPLGLSAGFLSLIPYVGIYVSLTPAVLLSYFEHHSWMQLLGVLAVYGAMEAIEGFVLIPKFLGKEVGLHPLTIIVTLLVFGKLFGFIGVLLSVPLAAITKILATEFVMPLVEEFAESRSGEAGPAPP